jgi:hypothetical protein
MTPTVLDAITRQIAAEFGASFSYCSRLASANSARQFHQQTLLVAQ